MTFSIGDSYRQIKICPSFLNHITTLSSSVIYGFFGSLGKPIAKIKITGASKINTFSKPRFLVSNSAHIICGVAIAMVNNIKFHR